MKLVYSILLSKEINKDEFVSFVKDLNSATLL